MVKTKKKKCITAFQLSRFPGSQSCIQNHFIRRLVQVEFLRLLSSDENYACAEINKYTVEEVLLHSGSRYSKLSSHCCSTNIQITVMFLSSQSMNITTTWTGWTNRLFAQFCLAFNSMVDRWTRPHIDLFGQVLIEA